MLSIKGFMGIDALVSNDKNITSILGELSPISRTYSREVGEYNSSTYKGYRLYTFNSVDVSNNEHAVLDTSDVDFAIQVVNGIVDYARNTMRPYDGDVFLDSIVIQFSTTIDNLSFGQFEEMPELALPQWVEFRHKDTGNVFRIWLSDRAFRQQYDLYQIEVIPYIDDIEALHGFYGDVDAMINNKSLPKFMEDVQEIRDNFPETVFHIVEYDYYNKLNTLQKRKLTFGILVHGLAGDNVDAIKNAIIDYLLENSTKSREEWEILIPDLFKSLEFTLLPRWDRVAIPNLTEMSEIYSPIVDFNEVINFATNGASHYQNGHVMNNLELFQNVYKFVMVYAIPGETNDPEYRSIKQLYPDYIPVQNTTLDFGRMEEHTRDWSVFIQELIKVAEYMTQYNTIPVNFRRITRDGKLYVSAIFNEVNYLVAAKSNAMYQR